MGLQRYSTKLWNGPSPGGGSAAGGSSAGAVGMKLADRDSPVSARTLRSTLGTIDLSEDRIADVRSILCDIGAVADVERRIEDLTDRALETLAESATEPGAAAQLRAMAIAATQRTY